jgi:Trk-type K+ transport system membrane component
VASKTKLPSDSLKSSASIPAPPLGGGFGRELANWLFPAFLAMILVGFVAIWKLGNSPGNSNPVRSLFIAMNAATCSGFNESPGLGSLNETGQGITLALIICGSLFSMIVGGLAVIRIARLSISDLELICTAVAVEFVALAVGTSLLWDSDRTPFQALFLAASAFGNCGLFIAGLPKPTDVPVHAVILPLSVLGGLGIPVLIEAWRAVIFHRKFSVHSSCVLTVSAWLYVGGLILLLAMNLAGRGTPSWTQIKDQLPGDSVLAIQSRTGGLAIARVSDLTIQARWLVVLLMAIGASPAGTGSGLKTTTLVELCRGPRKLLAGKSTGRSFGIAVVWLLVYMGMVMAAVLLLSYVYGPEPSDNILFNAVSGISNVGFTNTLVPDQKNILFAYCAIILLGRMAPLMVLWWMAESTADAELAIG